MSRRGGCDTPAPRGVRRAGAGGLAIVAVQRTAPLLEPPLYDGVIVAEPYRWLVPPPGAVGDPTSASATASLEDEANPLIAVATAESPPQAQIFASRAALVIPEGTTGLVMSIQPVLPQSLPNDGHIAGNVYRILVTNQAGVPLTAPASARVTIVLRGPETEPQVTMAQFGPDGWVPLETTDAGFGSTHLAVVTSFGDFTLIAPGPGGPYPTATAVAAASGSPTASGRASASGGANPGSGGPSSSPPSETASGLPVEPSSPSGGGVRPAARRSRCSRPSSRSCSWGSSV